MEECMEIVFNCEEMTRQKPGIEILRDKSCQQ